MKWWQVARHPNQQGAHPPSQRSPPCPMMPAGRTWSSPASARLAPSLQWCGWRERQPWRPAPASSPPSSRRAASTPSSWRSWSVHSQAKQAAQALSEPLLGAREMEGGWGGEGGKEGGGLREKEMESERETHVYRNTQKCGGCLVILSM